VPSLSDGNKGKQTDGRDNHSRHGSRPNHAASVSLALTPEFRFRHVGAHPVGVEDPAVNAITLSQTAFADADHPGKTQESNQGIQFVVHHAPALPNPQVKVQEGRTVGFVTKQSFAHENQVVVALAGAMAEEKVRADAVNECRKRL
jgi:hypothetical protein